MIKRVTARAFANIALIKYWGKQPVGDNVPATPSVSLALKALKTETVIERSSDKKDRFILNGVAADNQTSKRLSEYLNFWRKKKLIEGNFYISSKNDFPTKAGLASSASGFAALAAGLASFTRRKISAKNLSKLARVGSGSAARSITGGLTALPTGKNPAARLILPPEKISWGMVIVEIEGSGKKIGSRRGMELSRKYSPYYQAWVSQAKIDYRQMLSAIRNSDFTKVGEITEANALAMHACMIATRPSLLYWNPVTLHIIQAVQRWRSKGIEAYITIDAGPHVVILVKKEDMLKITRRARQIDGVISAIPGYPAEGVSIIKCS